MALPGVLIVEWNVPARTLAILPTALTALFDVTVLCCLIAMTREKRKVTIVKVWGSCLTPVEKISNLFTYPIWQTSASARPLDTISHFSKDESDDILTWPLKWLKNPRTRIGDPGSPPGGVDSNVSGILALTSRKTDMNIVPDLSPYLAGTIHVAPSHRDLDCFLRRRFRVRPAISRWDAAYVHPFWHIGASFGHLDDLCALDAPPLLSARRSST